MLRARNAVGHPDEEGRERPPEREHKPLPLAREVRQDQPPHLQVGAGWGGQGVCWAGLRGLDTDQARLEAMGAVDSPSDGEGRAERKRVGISPGGAGGGAMARAKYAKASPPPRRNT